jgi:hypothetical protein
MPSRRELGADDLARDAPERLPEVGVEAFWLEAVSTDFALVPGEVDGWLLGTLTGKPL